MPISIWLSYSAILRGKLAHGIARPAKSEPLAHVQRLTDRCVDGSPCVYPPLVKFMTHSSIFKFFKLWIILTFTMVFILGTSFVTSCYRICLPGKAYGQNGWTWAINTNIPEELFIQLVRDLCPKFWRRCRVFGYVHRLVAASSAFMLTIQRNRASSRGLL